MAPRTRHIVGNNELKGLLEDTERRSSLFKNTKLEDKRLRTEARDLRRVAARQGAVQHAAKTKGKASNDVKLKPAVAAGVLGDAKVTKKPKRKRGPITAQARKRKERERKKALKQLAAQDTTADDQDESIDDSRLSTPTKSFNYGGAQVRDDNTAITTPDDAQIVRPTPRLEPQTEHNEEIEHGALKGLAPIESEGKADDNDPEELDVPEDGDVQMMDDDSAAPVGASTPSKVDIDHGVAGEASKAEITKGQPEHTITIKEVVIKQTVNSPTTPKPAIREVSETDAVPDAISSTDAVQDVAMEDNEDLLAKGTGENHSLEHITQQQDPEPETQAQNQESTGEALGVEHGSIAGISDVEQDVVLEQDCGSIVDASTPLLHLPEPVLTPIPEHEDTTSNVLDEGDGDAETFAAETFMAEPHPEPTAAELTLSRPLLTAKTIEEQVFRPNIELLKTQMQGFEFDVYREGWRAVQLKGMSKARFDTEMKKLLATEEALVAHAHVMEGVELLDGIGIVSEIAVGEHVTSNEI